MGDSGTRKLSVFLSGRQDKNADVISELGVENSLKKSGRGSGGVFVSGSNLPLKQY